MISRIGYNECTEQLTDDPDGDMVLYEDYQALETENARLKDIIDELVIDIHDGDLGQCHKTLRRYALEVSDE